MNISSMANVRKPGTTIGITPKYVDPILSKIKRSLFDITGKSQMGTTTDNLTKIIYNNLEKVAMPNHHLHTANRLSEKSQSPRLQTPATKYQGPAKPDTIPNEVELYSTTVGKLIIQQHNGSYSLLVRTTASRFYLYKPNQETEVIHTFADKHELDSFIRAVAPHFKETSEKEEMALFRAHPDICSNPNKENRNIKKPYKFRYA